MVVSSSFYSLQRWRSPPLVSALVVTGRPGAGKTSIVQAVAKILQEDPKTFTCRKFPGFSACHINSLSRVLGSSVTDTYYVDVSRYSEQPISAVKGLFRYWFDKAAWHRPSILILDNLEKLLGAEVEVRIDSSISFL